LRDLAQQLRWLIGIRLVVITSVVLPYFLLQLQVPEAARYDFLYLLAGLTYLASLIYIGLLRALAGRAATQAYVQFIGDLLLISALVYYFAGISSPFSILYLIVIAVASTLLRRRAGLTVATIAWVLYAATLLGLFFGWLPTPYLAGQESASIFRLGYNLAVHLFGFYAVALLTSYLAQNIVAAEQELEAQAEHLADLEVVHRDVVESIPSGVITTDLEGRIASANRTASEILGRPVRALVGAHIGESGVLGRDAWAAMHSEVQRLGRSRQEVDYELDGEPRAIGFSLTDLCDAGGVRRGYIVIFQDLTEWRALQEELRLKDRMAAVGEMAAGLAHEIGNPLAAISGSVQMLTGAFPEESPRRKLVDIILSESQRLDRTIKGFLKFARPKDRSAVSFDVARLLAENFELLRNSPEVQAHHRLELELDPPSATLLADPDQLSQIFWNLARNALRAMPHGGLLRVSGLLRDRAYLLQVADTGRGMTEAERSNLFHPFRSFFDGGVGIGMAIVYRLVQGHGGRLDVQSRPGQGTTITVELPATVAAVARTPAAARA
jgi:two-component system sensor histidine kinase PilS (NtrC family)